RDRAVPDAAERDLLASLNTIVCMLQSLRRASTDNRPADIAEIAGQLRAGKNIHDDRRVRANRTAALIVRVYTLIAGGHDRMTRDVALGHDGCIDDSLQNLRG